MKEDLDASIVIIGAGPLGIAVAARLELESTSYILIERGPTVGSNMLDWGHINLFTSWEESVDEECMRLMRKNGSSCHFPKGKPTGQSFVELYLEKVAQGLSAENLILKAEVGQIQYSKISRTFETAYYKDRKNHVLNSRIIIDCSGTWRNKNSLFEEQVRYSDFIYDGIPDTTFLKKIEAHSKIAVVGNGHSAMNSLIEITSALSQKPCWLLRSKYPNIGKSKVGGKSDQLEKKVLSLIDSERIELITDFEITHVTKAKTGIDLHSQDSTTKTVDLIVSNIGTFPDFSFLKNISIDIDKESMTTPKLKLQLNPEIHSCSTVSYSFSDTLISDVDYYILGMKGFGTYSNFLLSTGYKIVDDLVAHLRSQ